MRYSIAIVFGMLPLYLVRFTVFEVPTNILEVALYGMFACALVGVLRKEDARNFFSLPQERLFRAGFWLLLLGATLSATLNPTLRAFGILKGWFFDPILFFLLIRYVRGSARATAWAYIVSATAVALVSLGYWLRGIVTYDGRLQAFF